MLFTMQHYKHHNAVNIAIFEHIVIIGTQLNSLCLPFNISVDENNLAGPIPSEIGLLKAMIYIDLGE